MISTRDEAPDIVVLHHKAHGIPPEEYLAELRRNLPEYDVRLAKTPAKEKELVRHAPIVTGGDISEEVLSAAEELKLFAASSAGFGHLPMERLSEQEVAVTTASGVHGPSAAEQAIGFILVFARQLCEGWRRQQRRNWQHFQSSELQDSTVTVVGLGAIGSSIAERLSGFGVETIGVRYTPEKGGPVDDVIGFDDDFHDALTRTDYLVLACPLTEITEGLVGRTEFEILPPDSVLVNVARGGIVNTDDLVLALRANFIGGAALDAVDPEPVPEDHPLWGLPNCLITPHNAGYTPKYFERLAGILSRNVDTIERAGAFEGLENQIVGADGEPSSSFSI